MNRNTFKGMAIMLAIVLLVNGLVVFAQNIQAQISDVNIFVNGVKLTMKDSQGNTLQPLVYNGSVYIPVRAVSEAVGKPVTWEGKTKSVYVGKAPNATTPALWLFSDWDNLFTWEGEWWRGGECKDVLGKIYNPNFSVRPHDYVRRSGESYTNATFNANGNYSKISGTFSRFFGKRANKFDGTLKIYGDDNLLYNATLQPGAQPIDFNVDITGYLQVKIEISSNRSDGLYDFFLGDVGLWP